jgi:hypothetical protein
MYVKILREIMFIDDERLENMIEDDRKVYEGKECFPGSGVCQSAYCADCFADLDWEIHDPGSFYQKWIAFCNCNSNQRMWTMSIETVAFRSISW